VAHDGKNYRNLKLSVAALAPILIHSCVASCRFVYRFCSSNHSSNNPRQGLLRFGLLNHWHKDAVSAERDAPASRFGSRANSSS
jgi:hypothetical protein